MSRTQIKAPSAGLSTKKLAHLQKMSIRGTTPEKGSISKMCCPEHHSCRKALGAFSEKHNKASADMDGREIASENNEAWTRMRDGIPGAHQVRYHYKQTAKNKPQRESQLTSPSKPHSSLREAMSHSANNDGHELRYSLPPGTKGKVSNVTRMSEGGHVKTKANQNHHLVRFTHQGGVGRRKVTAPTGDSSLPHHNNARGAGRRKHMMSQETSAGRSIWAEPSYPDVKQKVTAKIGGRTPQEQMRLAREANRQPAMGIVRNIF